MQPLGAQGGHQCSKDVLHKQCTEHALHETHAKPLFLT